MAVDAWDFFLGTISKLEAATASKDYIANKKQYQLKRSSKIKCRQSHDYVTNQV